MDWWTGLLDFIIHEVVLKMLNRTGGLDYRTMLTIFNPVIFKVDRFIGLLYLRSSDESIKILVDH